jgi:predicted nuclease of predicted toxin-antitoxin system
MRLLLDQGVPRSTAALLRAGALDAVHTGEIGLAEAEDETVLEWARAEGRTIVTLDADFHALLALSGASKPSVVRVRIEGLGAEAMRELLVRALRQCVAELERGALVSIQPGRLRLRRLPLKGAWH